MHDEVDNEDRRGWARVALDAFGAETGQVGYDYTDPEHLGEIAADLICNLLHLADVAPGITAAELIERARDHYEAEREDDEDDGEPKTYDHPARPDDDNRPGDRCKDCGDDITWNGPSHTDWIHVKEQ